MSLKDTKCLKCDGGEYVRKTRKEVSKYLGEVTVVSKICDKCGHDYYDEIERLVGESYQSSKKQG